jgi:hypothetical protein
MSTTRISVIEPLRLVAAMRRGARLRLVVRDRSGDRHVIRFYFADRREAARRLAQVSDWVCDRTPLAYVSSRRESALVEVDELLARACA